MFLKSELNSRSENTGPVTRDHVKFLQMRNEAPLQLQRLFHQAQTGIILFFRSQIHQCQCHC